MKLRLLLLPILLATATSAGCQLFPTIAHQPTVHNPFPQVSKIAIAPFFNLTNEPTVDGRKFALAYYNELQQIPGYEVVAVGVVEQAMRETNNQLTGPDDARRLAQALGVDAVVIGAVTDYTPYYPPRCAMQVEWYTANPGFHPIPAGYGLPWGTVEEQGIPGPLVFEAEMAFAKEQMKTQTPSYEKTPNNDKPSERRGQGLKKQATAKEESESDDAQQVDGDKARSIGDARITGKVRQASHETAAAKPSTKGDKPDKTGMTVAEANDFPEEWPDPRGFIPPPPRRRPPSSWPTQGPVMRHTQTYNGQDARFTEALESYYFFQDDARFGGWQNYLTRSDDFTRFCCRMHIWEMLTARGGAGETRVVWRWQTIR